MRVTRRLSKISNACEWVLAAHEKIRFAMVVDELGNVHCLKTVGLYEMPEELSHKIGDTLVVMAGSLFKELSFYHGSFEYAVVKHKNFSTVGVWLESVCLIFVVVGEATPELIKQVMETLKIYGLTKTR